VPVRPRGIPAGPVRGRAPDRQGRRSRGHGQCLDRGHEQDIALRIAGAVYPARYRTFKTSAPRSARQASASTPSATAPPPASTTPAAARRDLRRGPYCATRGRPWPGSTAWSGPGKPRGELRLPGHHLQHHLRRCPTRGSIAAQRRHRSVRLAGSGTTSIFPACSRPWTSILTSLLAINRPATRRSAASRSQACSASSGSRSCGSCNALSTGPRAVSQAYLAPRQPR